MATDLALLERQLEPMKPAFAQALAGYPVAPERLMRSVLSAYQMTERLADCSLSDIVNAAQTFAYLGLICDGVTGQGYILPFGDRRSGRTRAQALIGYRGYPTIASYARMSIDADVVREGDEFEIVRGTEPKLTHKPKKGNEAQRQVTHAWAVASSYDRPPIFSVLSMDELLAVRSRSPQWRANQSGPWRTDFAPMAKKSAIRDLGKLVPLSSFSLAARMEQLHEFHGAPVHIGSDQSLTIEADLRRPAPEADPAAPAGPSLRIYKANSAIDCGDIAEWRGKMLIAIDALGNESASRFYALNKAALDEYQGGFPGDVALVREAFAKKIGEE